jgi:ketosteroid isomerase-like protein
MRTTTAGAAAGATTSPHHAATPMSEDNVELVRRIYELWGRRESVREFLADDIEYVNPSYAVEPGTRRGPESFNLVLETYEDFEVEVDRLIDAGDDVVVLSQFRASGSGSGVALAGEMGYVWTLKDGKAVRFQWFMSHQEALDAAGLND